MFSNSIAKMQLMFWFFSIIILFIQFAILLLSYKSKHLQQIKQMRNGLFCKIAAKVRLIFDIRKYLQEKSAIFVGFLQKNGGLGSDNWPLRGDSSPIIVVNCSLSAT